MPTNLITLTELAKRLKVSQPYVQKLKKQGLIAVKAGKCDYEASMKLIESSKDPARAEFSKSMGRPMTDKKQGITFNDVRTALYATRTKTEQLELKILEGKYVDVEELKFKLQDLFINIRSQFIAMPAKVMGEVVQVTEKGCKTKVPLNVQGQISAIIRKEITDNLEALSKWKS